MVDEVIDFAGVPPSEIGVNIEMLSNGGIEAESQLPRPLHRTPRSSSFTGVNIQMTPVAGDEAEAPYAPTSVTGMSFQMTHVAGDEAEAPSAPSSVTGMSFEMTAVAGDEPEAPPAPSSVTGMNIQMTVVAEDEPEAPPAPSSVTGMNIQMTSVAGGEGADRDPPLPRLVHRFMRYCTHASIWAGIHLLSHVMEPTTENKKLIRVSVISLIGNFVVYNWLILRGGDLPKDDWKKIIFKIIFVFTVTLTLYASFSTLAANWFTLPGIVLCGVLAVGLGLSDDLTRLCKNFIATIKNETQAIRD